MSNKNYGLIIDNQKQEPQLFARVFTVKKGIKTRLEFNNSHFFIRTKSKSFIEINFRNVSYLELISESADVEVLELSGNTPKENYGFYLNGYNYGKKYTGNLQISKCDIDKYQENKVKITTRPDWAGGGYTHQKYYAYVDDMQTNGHFVSIGSLILITAVANYYVNDVFKLTNVFAKLPQDNNIFLEMDSSKFNIMRRMQANDAAAMERFPIFSVNKIHFDWILASI
ncbi:hypothetical protein A4G18_00370 [Pasteurellaceae bacterium Pebbles2]|nr:hypothetical protein [Pasteurellaceae bacterium Pebbles2]